MRKILILIFIFFISLINVGSAVSIDACQTLSSAGATYTLNQSVSSTGTCFTIGANNIILTSNNSLNQINFSTTSAGYGIYNNGYSNITVINQNITRLP